MRKELREAIVRFALKTGYIPYSDPVGAVISRGIEAYSLAFLRYDVKFPVADIKKVILSYGEDIIRDLLYHVGDAEWENTLFTFKEVVEKPFEELIPHILTHYFTTYGVEFIAELLGVDVDIPTYFPRARTTNRPSETTDSEGESSALVKRTFRAVKKDEYVRVIVDYLYSIKAPDSNILKDFFELREEFGINLDKEKLASKELASLVAVLTEDKLTIEDILRALIFVIAGDGSLSVSKFFLDRDFIMYPEMGSLVWKALKDINPDKSLSDRDLAFLYKNRMKFAVAVSTLAKALGKSTSALKSLPIYRTYKKLTRNSGRLGRKLVSKTSDYKKTIYTNGKVNPSIMIEKFGEIIAIHGLDVAFDILRENLSKYTGSVMNLARLFGYLRYVFNYDKMHDVPVKVVNMPTASFPVSSDDIHKGVIERALSAKDTIKEGILSLLIEEIATRIGTIRMGADDYEKIKNNEIIVPLYNTSSEYGLLPPGTRFSYTPNIIAGIHWYNLEKDGYKCRVDLDLSMMSLSFEGKVLDYVSWNSNYRVMKDVKIVFSGDVTDAPLPHGASELVYVDMSKARYDDAMVAITTFLYNDVDISDVCGNPRALFMVEDNVNRDDIDSKTLTKIVTPEKVRFTYDFELYSRGKGKRAILNALINKEEVMIVNKYFARHNSVLFEGIGGSREASGAVYYMRDRLLSRLTLNEIIDHINVEVVDEDDDKQDITLVDVLKEIG